MPNAMDTRPPTMSSAGARDLPSAEGSKQLDDAAAHETAVRGPVTGRQNWMIRAPDALIADLTAEAHRSVDKRRG
jgi:hypothetical protein